MRAYFLGPVLGHLLRLRRTTALHGGFVHGRRGAVGVVGPKGAGKSSLTAAWALAGAPVLADEMAFLAEGVVDLGVDLAEFLQGLHPAEPAHRPFSSSDRQVGILELVVQPAASFPATGRADLSL